MVLGLYTDTSFYRPSQYSKKNNNLNNFSPKVPLLFARKIQSSNDYAERGMDPESLFCKLLGKYASTRPFNALAARSHQLGNILGQVTTGAAFLAVIILGLMNIPLALLIGHIALILAIPAIGFRALAHVLAWVGRLKYFRDLPD